MSGVDDNLDWAGMYRQVANERDRLAGELMKRRRLSDGTEPAVGQHVMIVHDIAVRMGLGHSNDGLVHEITSLLSGDTHLVECGPTQYGVGMLRLANNDVTCRACLGWREQMNKMKADAEAYRHVKKLTAERDALSAQLAEMQSAWSRVVAVLCDQGCDCDGHPDEVELDEQCLGHRIGHAWKNKPTDGDGR